MKVKPLVTIIIVNWNGGKIFRECLETLKKLTYKNWELVVVDNGSTDESDEKAKKIISKLKLIRNSKNLGFAPANNQGYELSKGKYILLLNNDTKVSALLLDILVEKMEQDPSIGVMQPKIKMMDNPRYLDNAGSFFTRIGFLKHWGFGSKDSPEFSQEREVFSAKGACMFIRREVVDKVGLFDEDFVSYFEESDFCWRVWINGYRVLFYPKTYILHKVGFTIKRLDVGNINFHYYKNRISSLIKNLEVSSLFVILPVHISISIGISFVFLLRGKLSASVMIIRAIFWNINNLGKLLKKRGLVQKIRIVNDRILLSKLSRKVDWGGFFKDFKRVEKDIQGTTQ